MNAYFYLLDQAQESASLLTLHYVDDALNNTMCPVAKAEDALKQTGAKTFCFGGGVAANTRLRASYEEMCERLGVDFRVAPKDVCGDNAAMIGLAAQFEFAKHNFVSLDGDVSSSSKLNSRR